MKKMFFIFYLAVFVLSACAAPTDSDENASDYDDIIEYNGICKKKSELSADTVHWLEWYHSLPEEQQEALSFVPSEFLSENAVAGSLAVSETAKESEKSSRSISYYHMLTDTELAETAELARYYFTELSPEFGGVVGMRPAEDSSSLYKNKGLEDEYAPGNIIIYYVMTSLDQEKGNPMRSISIARSSKSSDWKVINSGY